MDIFSHGFWTAAGAEFLNRKVLKAPRRKLRVPWVAFWGVAPDLFSFGIAFVWLAARWVAGNSDQFFPHDPAHPELGFGTGDPASTTIPIARLTAMLYQFTHSAVIFFAVFGLILLFRSTQKRRLLSFSAAPWEMGGWLFHIFLDVPTHSYRFYPTPVLWPLFSSKFNGFSWGTPWFLISDYGLILLAHLLFFRKRRKRGMSET